MFRIVVAVVLAVAILGAAIPIVETARIDHANARVEAELDRLERVTKRLQERNDPAPPGIVGARQTVTLHLPSRSWASAGLANLTVPPPERALVGSGERSRLTYRVTGGTTTARTLPVALAGPDGGLSLERGGRTEVVLQRTRRNGSTVVVLDRATSLNSMR